VKPAYFDYERPCTLADAMTLLRQEDLTAKVLAGGQSIGPMLNLRLAQPDLLVDITGIPELKRIEETDDGLVIGACVTHADIEDRRVPDVTRGALPAVARDIAYRAVRNRGTLGGSLAHADPAADWISCLAAIGAEARICGPAGLRTVAVSGFMTGAFETVLEAGELIESVRVARFSASTRWGFCKISRKTGEMAQAIGAVFHDPERGICRAVIGATESVPIVISDASPLFRNAPAEGLAKMFDRLEAERVLDEAGIGDLVSRQLHVAALRRAVEQGARA
jgi:carbon-monoxide dehydrogenase medium subunit